MNEAIKISLFADGLDHPECIAVHTDGSVWAGGEAGQIYRIAGGRKLLLQEDLFWELHLAPDVNGWRFATLQPNAYGSWTLKLLNLNFLAKAVIRISLIYPTILFLIHREIYMCLKAVLSMRLKEKY